MELKYLILVILLAVLIIGAVLYLRYLPTKERKKKFKSWLLYAVLEAEKYFTQSKTGTLKLQYVYEAAIQTFPWVALFVSENKFKLYVQEACDKMEELLSTNDGIHTYVKGDVDDRKINSQG